MNLLFEKLEEVSRIPLERRKLSAEGQLRLHCVLDRSYQSSLYHVARWKYSDLPSSTGRHLDIELRAAELGVRPFDPEEWLAESQSDQGPEEVSREVDEFLGMLREWRDVPSRRGLG